MKQILVAAAVLALSVMSMEAAVTADLVIMAEEGTDDPQSAADGGQNVSYGRAQLNFLVEAGTGNVKLDSVATNITEPEIKAWGDRLDVLGEASLVGSPLSYVPEADVKVTITLNAVTPDGANGRLKADVGRGFGVAGSNPHRLDWNSNNAKSETLKIDVDTMGLAATHRLKIVNLILGNGEGNAVAELEDFSNGKVTSELVAERTVFELGSAHELIGGHFSSIYLRQAFQPELADDGFSLQGITVDILPYHGTWAGYYHGDAEGRVETLSLLGAIDTGLAGWVWSYDLAGWFYVKEEWVTHGGSWVYMPASSESALGMYEEVGSDWVWLYDFATWVYRPASEVTDLGSWLFINQL